MFRRLREVRRDEADDGTVTEHLQELADAE
jgi:hypothetical protein